MNIIKYLYLFIHRGKFKIVSLFDTFHTHLRFIGNDVKYMSFQTKGVPIVTRTKSGRIIVGDNFRMNNSLANNVIGYSTPCVFRAENGSILIGDNVGMSQTTLVASGADITIGDNTLFGGGCKVYTTDFHSLDFNLRRVKEADFNNRMCRPVQIGKDCFIGAGVFILKGVCIGDGVVVGAGSVVSKNLPAGCVAAGNPCRIIRG